MARPKRTRPGNPASWRLIGMVHLPALPGAPRSKAGNLEAIIERATREASTLAQAGFDAIIVENFGDMPFAGTRVPPETIAAMAIVVDRVISAARVPVGVNVLRNDPFAGLAIAAASGAAFIRVNVLSGTYATDQGLITGEAHELLRRRSALGATVQIAADVHVKHAVPISQPHITLAAEETAYRAGADILIVSGEGTGKPTDLTNVRRVREAVRDRPVWIGSGVTAQSVREYLRIADGVIVGTALKKNGRTTAGLDPKRVKDFVRNSK